MRLSRLLFPAVAAGLGLLFAFAAAELGLRLIAVFSPEVRYMSTARAGQPPRRFTSLQEYLASQPEHLVPHRPWFNYWTNAIGLNDEEFTVPKPSGRFRIMAVGDSFTYGLVPYPHNVMTLLDAFLRAACPGRDLDLLNFGIGGTSVADYRTVIELGYATYEPDLVLINFYAGNDGPDLHQHVHRVGSPRATLRHSYLWSYVRNALMVRRSVTDSPALATSVRGPVSAPPAPSGPPRGGQVIDPRHRLRDDDPALVGPVFEERAFVGLLAIELRRFYVPRDAHVIGRAWQPTLDQLEAARAHVAQHGGRLVITLYPSILQVDTHLRTELLDRLRGQPRHTGLTPDAIDPGLPSRILLEYCREQNVPCFDLTPAFAHASEESAEPLYKARELHWTVRGNLVAAEAQARHLAPLVCPAPHPLQRGARA